MSKKLYLLSMGLLILFVGCSEMKNTANNPAAPTNDVSTTAAAKNGTDSDGNENIIPGPAVVEGSMLVNGGAFTYGLKCYGKYFGIYGNGGNTGVYGEGGLYGVYAYGNGFDFYAASGNPSYFAGNLEIMKKILVGEEKVDLLKKIDNLEAEVTALKKLLTPQVAVK